MVAGEVDEEEEEEEQVHYSCRSLLHQERTNAALALLFSRSFSPAPSSLIDVRRDGSRSEFVAEENNLYEQ